MNENIQILIVGELISKGTSNNQITFTSNLNNPDRGDWGAIKFYNASIDANFDSNGDYNSDVTSSSETATFTLYLLPELPEGCLPAMPPQS